MRYRPCRVGYCFVFIVRVPPFLDIEAGCHLNVLRHDRQLPSGFGKEKDVASSGECLAVSTAGSDVFAASLDVYRPRLRIPYLAPVQVVNFAV